MDDRSLRCHIVLFIAQLSFFFSGSLKKRVKEKERERERERKKPMLYRQVFPPSVFILSFRLFSSSEERVLVIMEREIGCHVIHLESLIPVVSR